MPIKTPICDFGQTAKNFELKSTDNEAINLNDIKGENGTLIMFICNHCPYVKAIIDDIVADCKNLKEMGIKSLAICSNDPINYPDDSFENMIKFAKNNDFSFPYLIDETQEVAKKYGAVCTPDFFGYNEMLKLQYRGRLDATRMTETSNDLKPELLEAMIQISQTGEGPAEQIPSVGCSIKWK